MKLLIACVLLILSGFCIKAQNADSLSAIIEQYIDSIDPPIPVIDFIVENNINDASVCKGPNATYYLTGTTGDRFGVQDGIKVWTSKDLKKWDLVPGNGYVWTFSNDAVEWQRSISLINGIQKRGIISPKIYYWMNTFWIAYTNSNSNRSGILKSKSGNVLGPYIETSGDSALISIPNISLFFDSDSSAYMLTETGMAFLMKRDLSGIGGMPPTQITLASGKPIMGNTTISKIGGIYYLVSSRWNNIFETSNNTYDKFGIDARYDAIIATSSNLFGPYTEQQKPVQHAGGGSLLVDFNNNLWMVFTGEDVSSPIKDYPAFLPIQINKKGELAAVKNHSKQVSDSSRVVYVSPFGNNSLGNSWENAYLTIQQAIDLAPDNSQIWVAQGRYNAPVEIILRSNLSLYGGFKGNEKFVWQRSPSRFPTYINGRNITKHVFNISASRYIRIEGLVIQGGNASGESIHHQYGAGAYIIGGGETIRIVNCIFENNKADQDGGGVFASIGAAPIFINCTFKNNVSKGNGGAASFTCNANNGYHVRFYNCTFDSNFAYGDGGAIYFDSNRKTQGLLTVANCLIVNNTTLKEGGAVALDRSSNLLMLNNTVCFNKGISSGASAGSLGRVPAKSRIYNSIFYRNFGGSLFSIEGEADLELGIIGTSKSITNVWVNFENCLFEANEVNSLVVRNFDKRSWYNVSELNESVMGKWCLQGDPSFVDGYQNNFRMNNFSLAKSAAISNVFPYNLDKQIRSQGNSNIGCY